MSAQQEAPNTSLTGNPYARRVAELRGLMLTCMTAENVVAITTAMIERAKSGNISAAKLLFHHIFGKPVANAHPDRVDQDELEAFRANTSPKDIGNDILAVPLETTLELKRAFAPSVAESSREKALAQFTEAHARNQQKANPTVNKRGETGQSATTSVKGSTLFPESETLRLIDLPRDDQPQADRAAANKRHS